MSKSRGIAFVSKGGSQPTAPQKQRVTDIPLAQFERYKTAIAQELNVADSILQQISYYRDKIEHPDMYNQLALVAAFVLAYRLPRTTIEEVPTATYTKESKVVLDAIVRQLVGQSTVPVDKDREALSLFRYTTRALQLMQEIPPETITTKAAI